MFIVEIVFGLLLAVSAFFFVFFSFKKEAIKRNWLEVALWAEVFVFELVNLQSNSLNVFEYGLMAASFVMFVSKIVFLFPRKK